MQRLQRVSYTSAQPCKPGRRDVRAASGPPVIVHVPGVKGPIRFPHLGSGLLFARTTGLKVWPGSKALALLLAAGDIGAAATACGVDQIQSSNLKGALVVELGAGLGLCSLAAAAAGAEVVATDGDVDLVRLLKRNLAHNYEALGLAAKGSPAPRAAALPWGDAAATAGVGLRRAPDVVVIADCVYGSNPGAWERLVATLVALRPRLVIQAETPRVEGVQYDTYWRALGAAGFRPAELVVPLPVDGVQASTDTAADVGRVPRVWSIAPPPALLM